MTRHLTRTDTVKAELEQIRKKHGGLLQEEDVVSQARNPRSALHDYFIWDDTEAATRYRLIQAQELIVRMTVHLVESSNEPQRMYVSLTSDRDKGGGYRYVMDVLSDKARYARLLADAVAELQAFQRKYDQLKELKPIFREASKLIGKEKPVRRTNAA